MKAIQIGAATVGGFLLWQWYQRQKIAADPTASIPFNPAYPTIPSGQAPPATSPAATPADPAPSAAPATAVPPPLAAVEYVQPTPENIQRAAIDPEFAKRMPPAFRLNVHEWNWYAERATGRNPMVDSHGDNSPVPAVKYHQWAAAITLAGIALRSVRG